MQSNPRHNDNEGVRNNHRGSGCNGYYRYNQGSVSDHLRWCSIVLTPTHGSSAGHCSRDSMKSYQMLA